MGDIDFFPNIAAYPNAPSAILAYAEVTANQAGIGVGGGGAGIDLTGLSVSVNVPAGRRLRVSGHAIIGTPSAAGWTVMDLKEGSTTLGVIGDNYWTATTNPELMYDGSVILSPTAGTHTYKLNLRNVSPTVTLLASATNPAYIMVEDITGTAYPTGYTYPRGLLVYAAASGVSGVGTAATDVPNASLTITVPASRSIRLKGHIIGIGNSGVNSKVAAYIQEGATKLAFAEIPLLASVGNSGTLDPEVIHIPTAGTHTYKLVIQFNNGATNIAYVDPANGQYGYLYAEDITRIV